MGESRTLEKLTKKGANDMKLEETTKELSKEVEEKNGGMKTWEVEVYTFIGNVEADTKEEAEQKAKEKLYFLYGDKGLARECNVDISMIRRDCQLNNKENFPCQWMSITKRCPSFCDHYEKYKEQTT